MTMHDSKFPAPPAELLDAGRRLIAMVTAGPVVEFRALPLRAVVDELEAIDEQAPSYVSVAFLRTGRLCLQAAVTGDPGDRGAALGAFFVVAAMMDACHAEVVASSPCE